MTVYNFSAGPAVLPKPVLKQAQKEMLDYRGSGMSVMELSHRSSEFDEIIKAAELRLRDLMAIPDNYKVLFLQGGASLQFSMIPLNLAQKKKKAYYIVGGSWGKKAYTEAVKLSKTIDFQPELLASSEATVYNHIPTFDAATIDPDAAYVHLTTNNTIEGTTIYDLPDTNGVPIVADMSSNILAVRYNVADFGLIYAGAQKNIGPAGLVIVIIREDLLGNASEWCPLLMNYEHQAEKESMSNTPATYSWYLAGLVFDWLEEQGGVAAIGEINQQKADLLYKTIDDSSFYSNPVAEKYRSIMNVPFTLADSSLDKVFLEESEAAGLMNLKGHRDVGGMRASIYNAVSLDWVQQLVDFMIAFEKKYA